MIGECTCPERRNLFGVNYSLTNYAEATKLIIAKATQHHSYGVSALAVHGLIESYNKPALKEKVNKIDLIVPDGQPVRWALNNFFSAKLNELPY